MEGNTNKRDRLNGRQPLRLSLLFLIIYRKTLAFERMFCYNTNISSKHQFGISVRFW